MGLDHPELLKAIPPRSEPASTLIHWITTPRQGDSRTERCSSFLIYVGGALMTFYVIRTAEVSVYYEYFCRGNGWGVKMDTCS